MKINGNVDLMPLGLSVIKNAILDRKAGTEVTTITNPANFEAAEAGRIIFNQTTGKYHYNNGSSWQIFATAAELNAAGVELDNVETALGSMINGATGNFVASAFSTFNKVTAPTDLMSVLSQLDASIEGHDQFSELEDVTLTNLTNTQFTKYDTSALRKDGVTTGAWVNHTLVLADASDVTTTATELNQLHNAGLVAADFVKLQALTATAAELNELHLAGATNADFVKLHAVTATATELNQLTGSGVLTADLTKLHELTATSTELNYVDGVTSPIQTQLDNKQPLDADLTWFAAQEPVVLGSETLTINGETFTNTDLSQFVISTGTQTEGARWQLASKAAARAALGLGDAALLDETNFINATSLGNSNVATNISWNNYKLTSLAPGETGTDAVNLNQLQAAVAGLSWKNSALVATTANIDLATGGELTIDGVATIAGDRVLVKNQTLPAENGIYVVAAGAWARTTDFDSYSDRLSASAVFVEEGTTQADTGWTVTSDVSVLGTDPVTFTQFNGAAGITAGIALSKTGNTLDLNVGAGVVVDGSDNLNVDLYSVNSSALILTEDGSVRSADPAAKLHLLLDQTGNGKLEQSTTGLKVSANTITEAELTASVAGNGLTGGNGTALAVVSAAGTAATGGDNTANWAGVGAVTITADAVGVTLGSTSTTAAPGNHVHKAAAITFDDTTTSLTATDVQGALQSIDTTLDDVYSDLGNVKTAAGLNTTTGEFLSHASSTTSITAFKSAANMFDVDEALAAEIDTVKTNISNRISKSYFKYTASASALSHTVTHGTGQQHCNVTVIDITDALSDSYNSVVIPDAIKFNTANELVVTFNVPVKCIVVVMGLE